MHTGRQGRQAGCRQKNRQIERQARKKTDNQDERKAGLQVGKQASTERYK
jgi:hypothetical protein